MDLITITRELVADLDKLRFGPPVTYVYNPLVYAWPAYEQYLRRYGQGRREIVMFGMNPGPFGMAQTGVPFGEVASVRDWLGIEAPIGKPPKEHPKRPIQGFACPRSEVSGARVWSFAKDAFGTPERFFERFFILNYCPLCFMEESGRNRTPDKLPPHERAPLLAACDRALRRSIEALGPRLVIGIGAFAESRALEALAGLPVRIGRLPHPSPASPLANRGWAEAVKAALVGLDVRI